MNTSEDLLGVPLGEQEGQSDLEQRKIRLVDGWFGTSLGSHFAIKKNKGLINCLKSTC